MIFTNLQKKIARHDLVPDAKTLVKQAEFIYMYN